MTQLDTNPLFEVIPGDDPGGSDLRYDPVYDRIREFRREDDPRASRGIWTTKLKVADWSRTAELCAEVLERRSKDLQVACWLVEAVMARDGLRALPPALAMLGTLASRYWGVLWPRAQPDDEEDPREMVLSWLDTRLAEHMTQTRIASQDGAGPCWQDQVSAQRSAAMPDRKPAQRDGATEVDSWRIEQIDTAVERSDPGFLRELAQDITGAAAGLERLKGVLDQLCGGNGPSFSRSVGVLVMMSGWLRPHLLRRGIEVNSATHSPPANKETAAMADRSAAQQVQPSGAHGHGPQGVGGAIATRDEAYQALEAAAAFLERSEPHSPVHLLIRRALVWGRMPLADLLPEIMQDQALMYRLLGVSEPR
jgi:type VI secretion system protein ImpA